MEKLTSTRSKGTTNTDLVHANNEDYKVKGFCITLNNIDEMEDLVAMSNEIGESLGRSYEVPDCSYLDPFRC
jgi:hypothetical protein